MAASSENVDHGTEEVLIPKNNISSIKNRQRRLAEFLKLKHEKIKIKRKLRKKRQKDAKTLGVAAPPKAVPRTIESCREPDKTMVDPEDSEVELDEAMDEMAPFFNRLTVPKLLITTVDDPHSRTIRLCRELKQTIPNSEFRWRNKSSIKKMVKSAIARDYTDVIIIDESRRHPDAMTIIHLPDGPTAFFRMSNVKFCKNIKHRVAVSHHRPEIILNNFNTRLGHSVGRMLASLYHYDPEFHGRRVVTFHNQRDYIFFRHHRYEFKSEKKVALREIGPRFTIRLKALQKGTFDTKYGEFEWVLKRHEMETSRRRFFL